MQFPNYKNKHNENSVFSPSEFVAYMSKLGRYNDFKPPEGVILCYTGSVIEYATANYPVTTAKGISSGIHLFNETDNRVGIIGNFGMGAPIATALVEELIALGVKSFVSIGMAGTLQKEYKAGDIVVCDRAIRDEGTSYHYLEPSKYAYASPEITEKIKRVLEKQGIGYFTGASWTIDTPYRETVAEVKRYQSEGVSTVEMEASALFAVAQYRGVQMGAIFTISDSLAELEFAPKFHLEATSKGLEILCRVAIKALTD